MRQADWKQTSSVRTRFYAVAVLTVAAIALKLCKRADNSITIS